MLVKYPQENISPETLQAIGIHMADTTKACVINKTGPSLPVIGYALDDYLDGAESRWDVHVFVDPSDLVVKRIVKMDSTGRVLYGKQLETWPPNLKCLGLLSIEACEWAVGEVASFLDEQLPPLVEQLERERYRHRGSAEGRTYDFNMRVSCGVASSVARAISAGLYSPTKNASV